MASHRILATPPSEEAIFNTLLEDARAFNAREPRLYVGVGEYNLDAEMPLLLNPHDAPLACREPLAEFEAINAHFSAQVHAFFNALRDFEDMADKQSPDELPLIRPDDGLQPAIRTANQSFDIYPDCFHRLFHTRRLTVQDTDKLPLLHRVTRLRVLPVPDYEPDMNMIHQRPVSPRVPFELALRLPNLRELDCPWLWERLPIAFSSHAFRQYARVWEGPWRDARVEFAQAVRHAMPLLPPSFTKVRLWFWKPCPYGDNMDQTLQLPDLVGGSSEFDNKDPVSLSLRDLATRLSSLDIRALLTPDIFPSTNSSSWPHMRHLHIEFHPCTPTGAWYFAGPRGEDPHPTGYPITQEHYPPSQDNDADEATHELFSREQDEYTGDDDLTLERAPDMFRLRPVDDRINPLLLAFAESLQKEKMPVLRDAELFTWLTWRPPQERAEEYEGVEEVPPVDDESASVMFRWGVRYEAPEGDGEGKVTWQVGEEWRPAEEVMRAFEELVGENNMEWEGFEFVEEREQDPDAYD